MKRLRYVVCLLTAHRWRERRVGDGSGEQARFQQCTRCGRKRDYLDAPRDFHGPGGFFLAG